MWGVADQNESPRPQPGANLPESTRPAEIVDAEVVESEVVDKPTSATPPQQPSDEEEFRQYQQFLEFQRFREWQQSQGGDVVAPPPTAPPAAQPKKPWWKRALWLLRFKLVRRLIYLLLALLLIPYAIDYYFSGGDSNSGGGTGTGGVPADSVPVKSTNPQQAVRGVYNWLRGANPERACEMFDAAGKSGFAAAHQAPDCTTAANQVHAQITDPNAYANPNFGHDAVTIVGTEAQVLGCRMQVSGGPLLGSFRLTQQPDGGWTISAYNLQTPSCG
ncbi:hypothetical protein MOQ72_06605 [Saccharopolyspora sp. K220]|uniref:hypothetical protein n=1 Tax=Saccharopolyspora soli TaxID=2926618 RepID=UPI001F56E02C|nr:hypothetical protein [Saccharopolyspora soli]MCI2417086.1 hypothetical protein [Saccharopolyspora soli]